MPITRGVGEKTGSRLASDFGRIFQFPDDQLSSEINFYAKRGENTADPISSFESDRLSRRFFLAQRSLALEVRMFVAF
jgi:hypothetical protein